MLNLSISSSIVKLHASEKLTGDNYATRKSNRNTILVNDDLRIVLTEECPINLGSNANRTVWDAYDKKSKGKDKIPTDCKRKVQNADNGKCFHCNGNGHGKSHCPKYLAMKKAKKAQQGKHDLLIVEICLVEYDHSTWILYSGATNHICSFFFRKLVPRECLRKVR